MSELTQAERESIRRKNIIKNIAIVFLVILLILTFFSQTIMNYSLPEVATQMIESGSVSPQIRGTGTIEADDPYDVVVKEVLEAWEYLVMLAHAILTSPMLGPRS